MRTLKLTVAYDGTRFVGWQRQADGESIQGLLEQALEPLNGGAVTVNGAGRTDAGVHALGQVASVEVDCAHPADTIRRALNAKLPEDIRVLAVADAAPGFHARFSARFKTYRYQLRGGGIASPFEQRFVWHVAEPLDVGAMQSAAAALIGTHDFAAFQSTGTQVPGSIRTITHSALSPAPLPPETALAPGPLSPCPLIYEVTGDGFLRHMVRAIVGTLVEVGRGWRDPAGIGSLLAGASRAAAGPTAPPHGLFLVRVDYD